MMRSPSLRIALLLAVVTLLPIGVLGWLGLRILAQDRDVEGQRQREALAVTAGRLALDIERRLQEVEAQLARGEGIAFESTGPVALPDRPLLYQRTTLDIYQPPQGLAAAETAEFQQRDLAAAARAYRQATQSTEPRLRAAALVGLGRVLQRAGDHAGALRAYADLEALGATVVAGQPAALVAMQARCRLFEATENREEMARTATALRGTIAAGTWPIDRSTFDLYRDLLAGWGQPVSLGPAQARTEAVHRLWQSWRANDLAASGRRLVHTESGPVLAMWTGVAERPVGWFGAADEIEAMLAPLWSSQALAVGLVDAEGGVLVGQPRLGGVSLTPGETRLPFVVSVAPIDMAERAVDIRRAVMIASLLTAFALMMAAASGVYRATTREVALAAQQADFVSAVSHEFRTPLTSMRHLIDLLASRGVPSQERRDHYYSLLAQETERLHRMVETLLSFGRIDVGAYAWRLEPLDAGALVAEVREAFVREPAAEGREVTCEIEPNLPAVDADREALSRALWNLLENAAKYSGPATPITLSVGRRDGAVRIAVGDHGIGIQPAEQSRIFDKFTRGAEARRLGIRGVGIGLALVKQVVEAHGGSVELHSEPGCGSTFTLVLPCSES